MNEYIVISISPLFALVTIVLFALLSTSSFYLFFKHAFEKKSAAVLVSIYLILLSMSGMCRLLSDGTDLVCHIDIISGR